MDPAALPEIDLSLVTYNSQRWLAAYFASLTAQGYPLDKIHLHVIDHSPDEACVQAVRVSIEGLAFASATIERQANRGFGAGHNRTLALGKSRFVLVSNVDLTFEAQTLVRLIAGAVADSPEAAAWECRQKPYEHPKVYDIRSHETSWVSGACVLLRRSAWQSVRGFDERFFMYGEDVDLSFRLRGLGNVLRYCPDCVVWHHAYEQPGRIKEAQYFGATLANMYLRLRFGGWRDIAIGMLLQAGLLVHRAPVSGRLRKLFRNYAALARNAGYYAASRRKNPLPDGRGRAPFRQEWEGEGAFKSIYPHLPGETPLRATPADLSHRGEVSTAGFRKWDYARHREGAFVPGRAMPNPAPLVSIVVRTYPGRLPLLREALHSLRLQTWRPLQVIVVEDGGDTCRAYVTGLTELNPSPLGRGECEGTGNFTIVYHAAPRRGRCHTGNLGLALSEGQFVGFLDDDDLLYADHVETLVGALLASPKSPAAYGHAWEIETSFAPEGWLPYSEAAPIARMPREFDRQRLWIANYIPIQTVLFRRELYEREGGFCEDLDALEDWDLWQRYALHGDFLYIDKTTSIYRTPANRDRRPERMLALADHYRLATERQDNMIWQGKSIPAWRAVMKLRSPWYVTQRGKKVLHWIVRYPSIYAMLGEFAKARFRF